MSIPAHPGDLLSALLDGELTPGEAQGVRAHLSECAECQRRLGVVAEGRSLVRDLPEVEPPFGFYERMLRPKHRWARTGVAALAAGAVASLAFVAATPPREPPVAPRVAQLVDAHTASASTSGDPISEITPAAATAAGR